VKDEDFEIFLEDFMDMLNGLEASIVKMKQQIAKLAGVAEAAASAQPVSEQLEKLKKSFGELADYLTFTVKEGKAILTPRRFLGAENFAKVAKVVREHGGEYISAGKESRFELPLLQK